MLSLFTKISLIALWAIMAGLTLVNAVPGGLDLATALHSRANTPYIGVCFVSSRTPSYSTSLLYADAVVHGHLALSEQQQM